MFRRHQIKTTTTMAIFAMSLIAAAVASGDGFRHEKSPYRNTTTNTSVPVIKTTAGSTECSTATTVGESSVNPSSEITETATFSGCTSIGVAGIIDPNGCQFTFRILSGTTGTVDIQCPPNKEYTITSSKCTIHIPPQGNLSTATYSNLGAGPTREIEVKLELTNVRYTHTAGSGIGKCTTGSSTTGSISWIMLATSEDGFSNHIGYWVE